ncbi:MAG: NAD(P)/FAD-dependent oxidoreductase [Myxococcales bacterium]|nr:NAD(P)/FAD-dependent oxidoreductase [Myxococcales bacterium]
MSGGRGGGKAIVIGGGHNGLTCATLLARGGVAVTLVEARDVLGGLCAGETFAEGFVSPGFLHETSLVRPHVVRELSLDVRWRDAPKVLAAAPGEKRHVIIDRAAGRLDGDISAADQRAHEGLRRFVGHVTKLITQVIDSAPPEVFSPGLSGLLRLGRLGLSLRRLGSDMLELLRSAPMCVADLLEDRFEDALLKAALALPAVAGSFAGPWAPGTATNLLFYEVLAGREIEGGAPALVAALERAASAAGVTIERGARVERIRARDGRVQGVTLADGRELDAEVVAASCDPKTALTQLLARGQLSRRMHQALCNVRTRGTTAKVCLALSAPLEVEGVKAPVEALRVGETLDDIERAFDAVKYGAFSERPALDVRVVPVSGGEGGGGGDGNKHVASLLVHFAAREREGGWDDDAREALGDAAVARLCEVAPGVRDSIVAREVLGPADVEARYGLAGGQIHHGEHALDQLHLMRPTLLCSRYATPIAGLYLAGSGSHPGGNITCGPGYLAGKAILSR